MKTFITGTIFSLILSSFVLAQGLPLDVNNRLRVEYDDNIYLSDGDEEDSVKIIEELELIKNLDFDRSLLSLAYTPSFTYWVDREDDETDLHHKFDAIYRHRINETTGFNVSELLRIAELPELIDSGNVIRQNNDFLYNALAIGLDTRFRGNLLGDIEYKWNTLAYDEDEVADVNDFDQNIFGGSLRYEVSPTTQVGGEVRLTEYDYEDDGRDADSVQYGGVLKRQISDRLAGNLRAGWEVKDLDNANSDDADGAYVGGSLTLNPSEGTTFEVGANFSPAESPVAPYANQERTSFFARLNRQLTPKIDWNVAGLYADSDYDAEETANSVSAGNFSDGSEEVLRLSTRLSYKINRAHSVEANYQYTDLSSDIRAGEFERNRIGVGWRISL